MKTIILASTSPRRRELLSQAGLSFQVIAPEADEHLNIMEPAAYVEELSRRKCLAGTELLKKTDPTIDDACVIGADTIVSFNGHILGKPTDEDEAFSMLTSLSGHTHQVYTGVTVIDLAGGGVWTFAERTDVTFYPVEDEAIREYIRTGEPMDKAGGYGIQGLGVFLVKKIDGDYSNVVGLPVAHLLRILKEKCL